MREPSEDRPPMPYSRWCVELGSDNQKDSCRTHKRSSMRSGDRTCLKRQKRPNKETYETDINVTPTRYNHLSYLLYLFPRWPLFISPYLLFREDARFRSPTCIRLKSTSRASRGITLYSVKSSSLPCSNPYALYGRLDGTHVCAAGAAVASRAVTVPFLLNHSGVQVTRP